jgi:hypothetical protein
MVRPLTISTPSTAYRPASASGMTAEPRPYMNVGHLRNGGRAALDQLRRP